MSQQDEQSLGTVEIVDTGNITIKVIDKNILNSIQVNNLIKIQSTKIGEEIIGLVLKIMRKSVDGRTEEDVTEEDVAETSVENIIKASLIGTFFQKKGVANNIFKRTLNTVPNINAKCFLMVGDALSDFMKSLSSGDDKAKTLCLGKYIISEEADAYLDGNKFFQRHAVIVGSTGSGKSWTVSKILEESSHLPSVNSIIFDIHGEYKPLKNLSNTTLLRVASPGDNTDNNKTLYFPYWLLSHEEIELMILDRTDQNAPNQARFLFDLIVKYKKEGLEKQLKDEVLNNFTIDSPVPYSIDEVLKGLKEKDKEMIDGAKTNTKKQGSLHGKLTRLRQRLESKQSDKRLNFIFNKNNEFQKYEWLESLIEKLMGFGNEKGNKIIDFSEVPSEILPLITGLITRLIFSVQQWSNENERHPIAFFCDEAHLYIPADTDSGFEAQGLHTFQRVAKEGRKYGISLIVISQRPADVNKTVLSQCNNFIAMRLSNPDDQNVIRRLFPDSLGNFANLLPILDVGEGLIVGDACLLPSRVKINEPKIKPNSSTIPFWDKWSEENIESKELKKALENFRKQKK